MLNVFEWSRAQDLAARPWLVLGKGPSFSFRNTIDLEHYTTISLNHVVARQKVFIAHIIDMDVLDDVGAELAEQAEWLLMPFHPHVKWRASELSLNDFAATVPVLQDFEKRGRLLWYNLHSGAAADKTPIVRGTFSASVVINLLGHLGVKNVRSLGVDGGNRYSDQFRHLSDTTLLANGHESFDVQFSEIAASTQRFSMSYEKVIDPIRIFVGADDSQMVAGRVLEHSIRMHTQHPVEVFFMCNMPVLPPKDKKNRPGTGFSFNRFLIPKLAGYRGKAIYIDADMLVFDDIAKLWNLPMDQRKVLCSTQTKTPKGWEDGDNNDHGEGRYWTAGRQMSVMLMDCSQLDWDVDEIIRGLDEERYSYKELMAEFCILDDDEIGDTIPNEWNCLEWYEQDRSCLVHFTVVPTQPWKNDKNALDRLWAKAFEEAVAADAVSIDLIEESVRRKWIKPSLLEVAKQVLSQPRSTPTDETKRLVRQGDSEASKLRRMLWDSMVSDCHHRAEAGKMGSSIGWNLENTLVRKPFALAVRVARGVARRVKRLLFSS